MLTQAENDRITRVGAGTPMGELMRRYWHPIAGTEEMSKRPTKAVRLLGEDLVLYRDLSGTLGLIGKRCAHRGIHLIYGWPAEHGLRCPYHGWVYNETGQCIEQPAEPSDSTYMHRIKLQGYPVQELGGLIFAYLGPEPVPLLPRWDLLVWDNVERSIQVADVPCNWLQCMENSLDPVHNEWLHGWYGEWVLKSAGKSADHLTLQRMRHRRIGFDRFEYGMIKRRLYDGDPDDDESWRIGHPVLFPNILRVGRSGRGVSFQFRVPVDDEHTSHITYSARLPKPGETIPPQEVVPWNVQQVFDEEGMFRREAILEQDFMAWAAQATISDRTVEGLATTDIGIIWYRKLLNEQMTVVEDGGEPVGVFRDPAQNQCIVLPSENTVFPGDTETGGPFRDNPYAQAEVDAILRQ